MKSDHDGVLYAPTGRLRILMNASIVSTILASAPKEAAQAARQLSVFVSRQTWNPYNSAAIPRSVELAVKMQIDICHTIISLCVGNYAVHPSASTAM